MLSSDDESEIPAAWARLLLPDDWINRFGRDPRYADLVLYIEPGNARPDDVSPAGLAEWHRRFGHAARLPSALADYLASDLGLATSDDPATEVAVWLKARGASLAELVDTDGVTVVPGAQANWFIGLGVADQAGEDSNGLARTWIAEMCDLLHLDGHESVLRSLEDTEPT